MQGMNRSQGTLSPATHTHSRIHAAPPIIRLTLLLTALASPTWANVFGPAGLEFQVNTYTTNAQGGGFLSHGVSAAAAANGDFIVTWGSFGQDGLATGTSWGVFGQRFASTGAPIGPEFQINTYTIGHQGGRAPVAAAPNGDFIVVWGSDWQDGSYLGVFGQRFASSGARRGAEFQINTYTSSAQGSNGLSLATAANGDFIVVWVSNLQDGSARGLFGQRFASDGTARGAEFQINTYTTGNQGFVEDTAVTSADNGDFLVTWASQNQDGAGYGMFGQRFASNGAALASEFQINTYTTDDQGRLGAATVAAANGDFVVTWASETQDGNAKNIAGVFGRRFASNGAALGGEFQVNTFTTLQQAWPAAASAPNGDFVVTWVSQAQDGADWGLFAQRFASSGMVLGDEFQVNTYTIGNQGADGWFLGHASVAADDGSLAVAWISQNQDGDVRGVFGQRYANVTETPTSTATGTVTETPTETPTPTLTPTRTPTRATNNPPAAPDDHFMCYRIKGRGGESKFQKLTGINLSDVFASGTVKVRKPRELCLPAKKNSEVVVDEATHLVGYAIKPDTKPAKQLGIRVVNQFGELSLDLIKPKSLLVPSNKSLSTTPPAPNPAGQNVDYYTCYKARVTKDTPKFDPIAVTVSDQFTNPAQVFKIIKPKAFCAPVDKSGEGIKNANGYFTCYKAKRAKRLPKLLPVTGIQINNQFGPLSGLEAKRTSMLCVPSVVDPKCGNGIRDQKSEECDLPDADACPLVCQSDCTCAKNACGNNIKDDPLEQCDGADDTACPGHCSSLCTCPGTKQFMFDPNTSVVKAQTSALGGLNMDIPMSGSLDMEIGDEVAPGAFEFLIPSKQLPPVWFKFGGSIDISACPLLVDDPALPAGYAGKGVINCSGVDLTGTGFPVSPTISTFQDHCVEGPGGSNVCDSAPNPAGGVTDGGTGIFVPDGTVDASCNPPNQPDGIPAHSGACVGPVTQQVGASPYLVGDATMTMNLLIDVRVFKNHDPCDPPFNQAPLASNITLTTEAATGGIMDFAALPAGVSSIQATGVPFDCGALLRNDITTGAVMTGNFTIIDGNLIVLMDMVAQVTFVAQ